MLELFGRLRRRLPSALDFLCRAVHTVWCSDCASAYCDPATLRSPVVASSFRLCFCDSALRDVLV